MRIKWQDAVCSFLLFSTSIGFAYFQLSKFLRVEVKNLDLNIGGNFDPSIVSNIVATTTQTIDVPPSAFSELDTSNQWENSSTSKTTIFSNSEYEIDFVETRADSTNPCKRNNWSDQCSQPLELKFLAGTNVNAQKEGKWRIPFSIGSRPDVVEQIGDYVILIQTGSQLEQPRISQLSLTSGKLIYSRLLLMDIMDFTAPWNPSEQAIVAIVKAIPFESGHFIIVAHLNDLKTQTKSIVTEWVISGEKAPRIEWSKKLLFGVSNMSFIDEKLIQFDDSYESLEGNIVHAENKTTLDVNGGLVDVQSNP